MKIILTEEELALALRAHYPVPPEYVIEDVDISKYGASFCTINLVKPAPPTDLKAVELEQVALRA